MAMATILDTAVTFINLCVPHNSSLFTLIILPLQTMKLRQKQLSDRYLFLNHTVINQIVCLQRLAHSQRPTRAQSLMRDDIRDTRCVKNINQTTLKAGSQDW